MTDTAFLALGLAMVLFCAAVAASLTLWLALYAPVVLAGLGAIVVFLVALLLALWALDEAIDRWTEWRERS